MAPPDCNYNLMPEFHSLYIPKDLKVFVLPGENVTATPMQQCCSPNPVQQAWGCYLWCEYPEQYINGTKAPVEIAETFYTCLKREGLNYTSIYGSQSAAQRPVVGSSLQIGLLALSLINFLL